MSSPSEKTARQSTNARGRSEGIGWPLRNVLLASHAALAALIVVGFGITLYVLASRATYRQVEGDLLGAAQALRQSLDGAPESAPLTIPEALLDRLGRAPRDRPYFAVWDEAGNRIADSRSLPPHVAPINPAPPISGPHPFATRRDGPHLDVAIVAPGGGQVLVGRPMAREFDFLNRLAWQLVLTGIACLALGGLAAWWLARQLARPIVTMAATAERVTSRNLDERVVVGRTPREIARLGLVFNGMLEGLHDAFARQTRFTADASHELRTPVAVVLSQAEHSLARERTDLEYRAALETCLRAAQRMRRLIDDLLLLARADSGRLDLRRQPLDLAEVCRGTIELLRPWARDRAVELRLEAQPALVRGDDVRLGQVVSNLVTNAVQHSPAGSAVTIRSSVDRNEALLAVEDRGAGIAIKDQARLFDRFFRVDTARTQAGETGTGLGLSLVAEIVAAHGGRIAVQSAPGLGTTMTVRLPLAPRDSTAENSKSIPSGPVEEAP